GAGPPCPRREAGPFEEERARRDFSVPGRLGGESGAGPRREGSEGRMKLPKGFLVSGVRAGIRKKRPDVALLVAERGANAAAVFTRNKFQAAPVVLSKAALKRSKGRVAAVVVNAGCANAITGKEGT